MTVNGAGAPLIWQANRRIHPGFEVNLANGNVYFQLVTAGFRYANLAPNPALSFSFNPLALSKSGDYTAGFNLGDGWTSSLGSRLEFPATDSAILTQGDGSEVPFTWTGSSWECIDGYFLQLTPNGSGWKVEDLRHLEYHFDANGAMFQIVSNTGNVFEITYSGGKATKTEDPHGREVFFGYDGGKLESITDDQGRTWWQEYDSSGRLDGIVDPEYGTLSLNYNAEGFIDSLTDYDDYVWSFDYFESGPWQGRIKKIIHPDSAEESYAYLAGQTYDRTTVTNSHGHVWTYFHDRHVLPALVRFKNPLNQIWKRSYNNERLMESSTDPLQNTWTHVYNTDGRLLTTTDPLGQVVSNTYDALGNLLSTTQGGFQWDYAYEDSQYPSLLTKMMAPPEQNGAPRATTTSTYYGPNDGPTPGIWNGLIASVTDPEGVETRFTYNGEGMYRSTEEGPAQSSGRIEIRHDLDTRPVFVDHGGMQYPTHFPTIPTTPSPVEGRLDARVQDPFAMNWRGFSVDGQMTLTVPIDSGNGVEYSEAEQSIIRDHFGRYTQYSVQTDEIMEHVTVPPPTSPVRSFVTTFDSGADAPIVLSTPDGDTVTYLHDNAGRRQTVTAETSSGDQLSTSVVYRDDGRIASVTRSDGSSTEYDYYTDGTLERIEHLSGPYSVLTLEYEYNDRKLPTKLTESTARGATVKTYAYDSLSQLISETHTQPTGASQTWTSTYDLAGNRLTHQVLNDNIVAETAIYHYDLEDPLTYQSANNRLCWIEVLDNTSTLESTAWFFYDNPFGNVSRIVENVEGTQDYTAIAFVYDETGLPWLSWDESWQDLGSGPVNVTRQNILETRQDSWRQRVWRERDAQTFAPIGQTEWVTRFGSLGASYVVNPQDGSLTRLHLDIDGIGRLANVGSIETYASDRMGSVRLRTADSQLTGQEANAFGEELVTDHDSDAGFAGAFGVRNSHDGQPLTSGALVKMGFRHYSPRFGRFLMRDPIGILGDTNVYMFVDNSPTAGVDPMGLDDDSSWLEAAGSWVEGKMEDGATWICDVVFGPGPERPPTLIPSIPLQPSPPKPRTPAKLMDPDEAEGRRPVHTDQGGESGAGTVGPPEFDASKYKRILAPLPDLYFGPNGEVRERYTGPRDTTDPPGYGGGAAPPPSGPGQG